MPSYNPQEQVVTFDNEFQSNLFLEYLEKTKIRTMRDHDDSDTSLKTYYGAKYDEKNLTVTLGSHWGTESLVSKFMEITKMVAMDYTEYMISDYVPYENPSLVPLARQGEAIIPKEVLQKMQEYVVANTKIGIIKKLVADYKIHLDKKVLKEGLVIP